MKLTSEQVGWIKLGGLLGLVIASLTVWMFIQQPSLVSKRLALDSDRVSLATLEEQRANQATLEGQAEELKALQTKLDPELWHFVSEPEFFSVWDRFGEDHGVELDVKHVADVVPGNQPVRRNAEINVTGTAINLFEAINALMALQPLISIQNVQLVASQTAGQLTAAISLETIWK